MSLRDTISLAFGDGRCFRPQKTKWGLLIGRAGRFSISIYRPAGGRNRCAHTAESENRKFAFASQKFSPSATVQKLFSSILLFSDFKISSQAQAVSQFLFTALLVVAKGARKLFFSDLKISSQAQAVSQFPYRPADDRNRRAHTNEIDLRKKKIAFALRKFSLSATVLKLFSSTLFFSDFKFFRPSEALARENFPISNVSRPRVVLYFLLSLARATRVFSLLYIFIWAWRICPP